ncbi:MAG: RsmB/NOP family class I SAM-dependent RNA methyltransferase [Bauldia sp.]|nr:RsmB/NOP family class I SAM-dependent RNA methyltransferase [Bauldia sp.]
MGLSQRGARPQQRHGSGGRSSRAVAGLPARAAAVTAIIDVLEHQRPFESDGAAFVGLEAADRGLARAIVGTTLRRHGEIRGALDRLMSKPPTTRMGKLSAILDTAAAQILFMDVPDHAAVSLALELAEADPKARHFKPLANGVLRALARERETFRAETVPPFADTPKWLAARWRKAFGEAGAAAIAEAHRFEAPLDVTVRDDPAGWAEKLGGVALPTGSVRLDGKGRIEAMPGFAEGAWWVQDVAAALPARLLGDVGGKTVLDLCAAPGGKTAQLAAAGAVVTALDLSPERLSRLKENLARLKLPATTVAADGTTYDPPERFDAVLLDAPCSATGTIRRHPDIPFLKRESDLASLAVIQQALLARAVELTKPGGTIVFATCSLEPEESEAQIEAALRDLPVELMPLAAGDFPGLAAEWVVGGVLRTTPGHAPGPGIEGGMDGFFAARLRRR